MIELKGKTVVFLAGGIGDQLMHFSQIQHLAEITGQKVDIYCQHRRIIDEISKQCDWLGFTHDIKKLKQPKKIKDFRISVSNLRQANYSNALVMHPSTTFKLASLLSGAKYRIGFEANLVDKFLLNVSVHSNRLEIPENNVWGHRPFGSLFSEFLDGIQKNRPEQPPIKCSKHQTSEALKFFANYSSPHIIINLFSKDKNRRWPIEKAVNFLTELVSRHGARLFLSSGDDAKEWNREFLSNWPKNVSPPIEISKYFSGINSEIALYCNADFYIGVNSFTSHLSMNCDLPSLVLYNKKSDYLNYRNNSIGIFPNDTDLDTQDLEGIKKDSFLKGYKKLRATKK